MRTTGHAEAIDDGREADRRVAGAEKIFMIATTRILPITLAFRSRSWTRTGPIYTPSWAR